MAFSSIIGAFNIFVGLMLAMSILLMGGGLIFWYVRLGTYPTYRDDAIELMKWAVAILFVLVVLLGIAQFIQSHLGLTLFLLGVAFVLTVIIVVLHQTANSGGGEEEKK